MTPSAMGARVRLRAATAALALAALAVSATSARAEGPQDRFWGQLEYFFPTIDSTARLDVVATDRPGSAVRLEDDLGLDDRKGTPYLLLGTRLGERWRLEFEFYRLERTAERTIDRAIDWGDVSFPLAAQVASRFDSTVYRLVGGYSFVRTPQAEFGAALGLHVTDFTLGLSGQASAGGGAVGFQREDRDTLVPLPTLGLYGSWHLADQWVLRGRADLLSLKVDAYDGRLVNLMAGIDWRVARHWGVGLGYRYVDYQLESTDDAFRGEVNYNFRGPTLYVTAAF